MRESVIVQKEYDLIFRYFKATAEPYDDLEWGGEALQVWYEGEVIEKYSRSDLCEIIRGFGNL